MKRRVTKPKLNQNNKIENLQAQINELKQQQPINNLERKIYRLEVIGLVLGFVATGATLWLGINQLNISEKQTIISETQTKIAKDQAVAAKQQLYLTQAQINVSQNYMLGPLYEEIAAEAKALNGKLSDALINRIASVSHGLRPYHYMTEDGLSNDMLSPERGQLLLYLLYTSMQPQTMDKIYKKATFSYSDLHGVHFPNSSYLKKCDLASADLTSAWLWDANLNLTQLSNANLTMTDLRNANLTDAFLKYAILTNAFLDNANLKGAVIGVRDTIYFKGIVTWTKHPDTIIAGMDYYQLSPLKKQPARKD